MPEGILVVVDQHEGQTQRVSFEMISAARRLQAGMVTVLARGNGASDLVPSFGRYGAERAICLDGPSWETYSSDGLSDAIADIATQLNCVIIFFPATAFGKDLGPRVAGVLDAGMASDCIELGVDDAGTLFAVRPIYAGKAWARVKIQTPRKVFSIRPNVQSVTEDPQSIETVALDLDGSQYRSRAKVTERIVSAGETVELTEADVIVSGGRGLKAASNYVVLEPLAKELGAALGSSRPLADEGWVPHSYHIGQTGKVVSPTVYFAIGISGAIQHLAGISGSKYIVAINSDADAPIFKAANYGIVGDLFEVVPALTEAIAQIKEH